MLAGAAAASIVSDVRSAARSGDFVGAERLIEGYRKAGGATSELALAVSWIGREALASKDYDRAEQYAGRAREMSLELLKKTSLGEDGRLRTALGASIEVQGQVMAARGELSEAIAFLNEELERWRDTPIRARIQKNINLLSLVGKPAPPLELREHIGVNPPALAELKGKVVLLFFWAHWCPDCKMEAPVLGRLMEEYGKRGLVIIGPTKRYGFVAGGEDATPEEELKYIGEVVRKYYAAAKGMTVPISGETFANYGSSTTPTLVLVDRKGIVRLYHPGEMSYDELREAVEPLI